MRRMMLVAVALAGACYAGYAQGQDAPPVDVVFTSKKLDKAIVLGAPVLTKVGPLQRLALPVENTSRKQSLVVEYRVEWFDESGVPAGNNVSWKTVFLDAQEQRSIQEVAQRPNAVSARITMRGVGAPE